MGRLRFNQFLVGILYTVALFIYMNLSMTHHSVKEITEEGEFKTVKIKPFGNIVLVVIFNFPHYENIPVLRHMYDDVFGKVVFCGPTDSDRIEDSIEKPDFKIKLGRGYHGYHCTAVAMETYPGYEGYMSSNDDMIINWWNLVHRDKTMVWEGSGVSYFTYEETSKDKWAWWNESLGLPACKNFYKDLKYKGKYSKHSRTAYQIALFNGGGLERCGKGWSDYFYIPGRLVNTFREVSGIAYNNRLFLEIAVPTILRCLDHSSDFEKLDGAYLPSLGVWKTLPDVFWKYYNHTLTFIHPFKFYLNTKKLGEWNMNMLDKHVINHTKLLLTTRNF